MRSSIPDTIRRLLILDFDGVLVDSEPLHFQSWNQAFAEQMNIHLPGDYRQLVGLPLADIYALWAASVGQDAQLFSRESKQALLDRKNELFFKAAPDQLRIMPGSVDLMQRAYDRGWYVALASRARRLRLHRTLRAIQFPLSFDLILGTEDVLDPTSDRKDHGRAGQPFGIEPAACVVIEDSLSGIADACAGRIGRVIGLTSSFDREALIAAGAHEVVDSLEAVPLDGDRE